MNVKKFLALLIAGATCVFASDVGVVNFSTCIMESKYGRNEQGQLESIKQQWSSVLEQTEKEFKDVSGKLEDSTYMEGLSQEAAVKLKTKQKTLSEDMAKYQNQLYQVMNQANYIFVQKMISYINKASQEIATKKKFNMIVNKEMCFYHQDNLDITKDIISVMDTNYEKDKKLSEKQTKEEQKTAANQNKKAAPVQKAGAKK